MSLYHNFIGVDIGKFTFVANIYPPKATREYTNDSIGVKGFIRDFKAALPYSLVVLETTGGYEMKLLKVLCNKNYRVHRSDTRKVKSFIKSFGFAAKTDSLDAKALALYGYERHERLGLFEPASEVQYNLYELAQRRKDLNQMLVAEKNRLKAPRTDVVEQSCRDHIEYLANQISSINKEIAEIIKDNGDLPQKLEVLKTIPGIGDITAANLLALLPEIGTLTRRKIAALVGLAPRANDSGLKNGYRRTGHGRDGVKPALFLSAMAARNSKSELGAFYNKLRERGKEKMVALTALMRKILVVANARVKESVAQTHICTT